MSRLCETLRKRGVRDPNVLRAVNLVPRHRLVPEPVRAHAYEDRPLPIGYAQTISQPYVVAYMTEALGPEENDRVLEIGTGSGYQAALLSHLVREVHSLEIIPPLAETAAKNLADLRRDNVRVEQGDGYHGLPERAPFDGIIVTAATPEVPPPLLRQLRPGGRMVVPVGKLGATHSLRRLRKTGSGDIEEEDLLSVRFVPFTRLED